MSLKKILLNNIAGFGPQTAAEIIHRSGINPDERVDFRELVKNLASIFHPRILPPHKYCHPLYP